MRNPLAGQSFFEGPTSPRGEIVFGIGANHRTNAVYSLERPRIRGIEGCTGLEARIGARPSDGKAAAHAESNRAHALGVDVGELRKEGERGLQIVDAIALHRAQEQSGHVSSHADGSDAVGEQIDGEGRIPRVGEAARHILDVIVQAERFVYDHHARMRAVCVGPRKVATALELAGCDLARLHLLTSEPTEDGSGRPSAPESGRYS